MPNLIYYKYLCHHGIQGQKWGVRRGPPYPIEDTTLHKGQKLNTVHWNPQTESFMKNRGKSWTYTYNPEDAWDSKVYKGPFSYYKTLYVTKSLMYEHQFEVVKDLKMPTSKERLDNFIQLYGENKSMFSKELKTYKAILDKNGVDKERREGLDLKNIKTREDFQKAYTIFNHMMENVERFKSTKKYAELMSKKFDAMVDDNNQGVYNNAHDPIIIFRANEALKQIGEAKVVDVQTMMKNLDEVGKELQKEGKKVKL